MSTMFQDRALARLALCLIPWVAGAVSAQSIPHTLVIVADDVGVDAIGCYGLGAAPPPTPNIDGLAARGVRFANAQSCPLCSPTRGSLLTGRHGFRTGVGAALGANDPGLAASEVLLPEILGPAGVRTALIGKWHLGDDLGPATPTAEGFAEFTGNMQGALNDYYRWPKVRNGRVTIETNYATTDLVDEALAFVLRTSGPWFLMLSFQAGHTPLHAPPAHLHTQNLAGLDPSTSPVPFFKAMVQAMDTELGRLFAGIPAATLARTNIVFLGDNGSSRLTVEAPFDATRAKGSIYQGGIHVPCIVAGPAIAGGPRVEPGLLHAVDLFPTLARLQGVDARAAVPANVPLDGLDQGALLRTAGQPAVRRYSYSQGFVGAEAMSTPGDTEMMRDAQFELLRFVQVGGSVREELYDLASDPWEVRDLLLQPLTGAAAAAYRALWQELARLRGYPAALTFGAACSGAGVTPTLRASTAPRIDSTFNMQITGLTPTTLGALGVLGFDATQWHGTPLPLDLGAFGMPSCALHVAPDFTAALPHSGSTATWDLPLPADAALVGLGCYAQAVAVVPAANPTGVLASGALAIVIGR